MLTNCICGNDFGMFITQFVKNKDRSKVKSCRLPRSAQPTEITLKRY